MFCLSTNFAERPRGTQLASKNDLGWSPEPLNERDDLLTGNPGTVASRISWMRMNGPRTRAKVCQTIGSPRRKLLAIASISPLAPSRSWSSPSTHAASASIAAMATPGGTGCASPWETRGASRKWRSQSQRAHSWLSQRHKGSASHSAGRCAHRLSRPQSYFPRRRSCSGRQTPARPPRN